jgi:hypothetical protein
LDVNILARVVGRVPNALVFQGDARIFLMRLPSDLLPARDRSIKAINLGLLLRDTVSISALGMLTRIATGLPSFVMITGSFSTPFV